MKKTIKTNSQNLCYQFFKENWEAGKNERGTLYFEKNEKGNLTLYSNGKVICEIVKNGSQRTYFFPAVEQPSSTTLRHINFAKSACPNPDAMIVEPVRDKLSQMADNRPERVSKKTLNETNEAIRAIDDYFAFIGKPVPPEYRDLRGRLVMRITKNIRVPVPSKTEPKEPKVKQLIPTHATNEKETATSISMIESVIKELEKIRAVLVKSTKTSDSTKRLVNESIYNAEKEVKTVLGEVLTANG